MLHQALRIVYSTWPPPLTPHVVGDFRPVPIGACRIRRGINGTAPKYRCIKVRMAGDLRRRWITAATFWWLQNVGPVPAGKYVGRLDGDPLNDDPSNYALLGAGEAASLWHMADDARSTEAVHRGGRRGGEASREIGRANRAARLLRTWFYPVDMAARLIINMPGKTIADALAGQRDGLVAVFGRRLDVAEFRTFERTLPGEATLRRRRQKKREVDRRLTPRKKKPTAPARPAKKPAQQHPWRTSERAQLKRSA